MRKAVLLIATILLSTSLLAQPANREIQRCMSVEIGYGSKLIIDKIINGEARLTNSVAKQNLIENKIYNEIDSEATKIIKRYEKYFIIFSSNLEREQRIEAAKAAGYRIMAYLEVEQIKGEVADCENKFK